jgi:hypothetical protein
MISAVFAGLIVGTVLLALAVDLAVLIGRAKRWR